MNKKLSKVKVMIYKKAIDELKVTDLIMTHFKAVVS